MSKKKKSAQGPSAFEMFSRVVASCEPGGVFGETEAHRSFGFTPHGISVRQENARQYQLNLRALYRSNDEIRRTWSLVEFEKKLASLATEIVHSKREPSDLDVATLLDGMLTDRAAKCNVVCPIYGVSLASSPTPLELGPFVLFNKKSHADSLRELLPSASESELELSEHYIKVAVTVRDGTKARELADELFEKFESLIRFMIGYPTSRLNVVIAGGGNPSRRQHFIVNENGKGALVNEWNKVVKPLDIGEEYFVGGDQGFRRLWDCLKVKSTSSALEQRLLLAADWVGQSFDEPSLANAFLKATIALEILFSRQVNSLVVPSLLSQISESVALILADNADDRLTLDKEMRRLYGMRSSIAHHGKQDVLEEDVGTIQQIARNVIVSLLTSKRLEVLKNVDDLAECIKSLKYSGGPFEVVVESGKP